MPLLWKFVCELLFFKQKKLHQETMKTRVKKACNTHGVFVKTKDLKLFISRAKFVGKKYRLVRRVDGGAFGDIYLGTNVNNNEEVAIKIEKLS